MTHQTIAVIRGDGIGSEVIEEGLKLFHILEPNHIDPFQLIEYPINADQFLKTGMALPDSMFQEIATADAIYFGAIGDPRIKDPRYARDILLRLRFELDLYINQRPVRLYHSHLSPLKQTSPIDFTILRENTEGVYVNIGGIFKQGTSDEIAIQEEVNTFKGVERIQRYAFQLAQKQQRPLLMSDKANAMSYGHGLWQRVFQELKAEYSDVVASHLYVDVLAMKLVTIPSNFGVIVTNNLFGDILADLGAGLVGGLGFSASANFNPHTRKGLFEPVHGSAPDIAGQGKANPIAAILSLKMMLDFLNQSRAANWIEESVVLFLQKTPPEILGSLSTSAIGDGIAEQLKTLMH